jgi:hypothetical protein
METKCLSKIAGLFFLLVLAIGSMPGALACDEPGTPNQEQLRSEGHGQLIYSFESTARTAQVFNSGSSAQNAAGLNCGKVTMYFDMNMGDGNNPQAHNWTYVEDAGPYNLCYHQRVTLVITRQQTQQVNPANRRADLVDRPLVVGKNYCMTVWARTSPGGCRSRLHSSWQCATVRP